MVDQANDLGLIRNINLISYSSNIRHYGLRPSNINVDTDNFLPPFSSKAQRQ